MFVIVIVSDVSAVNINVRVIPLKNNELQISIIVSLHRRRRSTLVEIV